MLARNADAFCRSRHVVDAASVKITPDFIKDRMQPSSFCEIFIDLPVPCFAIALPNECH